LFALLRRHLPGGARLRALRGALLRALALPQLHPAALPGAGSYRCGRAARGGARRRGTRGGSRARPVRDRRALTAPLLGFFDFFAQTEAGQRGEPSRWLRNAGFVVWTLPAGGAGAARAAVEIWLAQGLAGRPRLTARLSSTRFLWLTVLVHALAMLGIPFLERYFVVLGPLLALAAVLDLASARDARAAAAGAHGRSRRARARHRRRPRHARHARARAAGRVAEIRAPYRGPPTVSRISRSAIPTRGRS
jgi:hypothetical protein